MESTILSNAQISAMCLGMGVFTYKNSNLPIGKTSLESRVNPPVESKVKNGRVDLMDQ